MVVELSPLVVETFGPFVIPAVLFLVGVAFYAAAVLLSRLRRTETYRADE